MKPNVSCTDTDEEGPIDEYDGEIDGCLHGVTWDDDCWECDLEAKRMNMGIL